MICALRYISLSGKLYLKNSSLNSANAPRGGGEGFAQISGSPFYCVFVNLDNLKRGGVGPCLNLLSIKMEMESIYPQNKNYYILNKKIFTPFPSL